jgi:SAM-dependent methyltransferase
VDDQIKNNRQVWEDWTRLHLRTDSDYQEEIKAFEAGMSTLSPIDLEEVGDVQDKVFLHLMCHFGLDSLSWAKRGARVTGVDFSTNSITAAREFAKKHNISAEFLCADVYELPENYSGQFDLVYAEGGILAWLPELGEFTRIVARCLKPGGIFYLRDNHPFRRVIFPAVVDRNGDTQYYRYFSKEPTCIEMEGSYAQPKADSSHKVYFWVHNIGEIITELSSSGLHIEFLHEFPKIYETFPTNIRIQPGKFEQHILKNWPIPNIFSLRAKLTE